MTRDRCLHILRHALGVQRRGRRWTRPYRNRFDAGGSDALPDLRQLARDGLVEEVRDGLFRVTPRGLTLAAFGLPRDLAREVRDYR